MCKLYLSPFCSEAVPLLEEVMSVLVMILGWNVCFSRDVTVWSQILNFLREKNDQTSTTHTTKTFGTQIRKTINNSETSTPREIKWQYINWSPSTPSIKGLIKIHKPDQPTRPIVNWHSAPAYKLSKLFTQQGNQLTALPYCFNITKYQRSDSESKRYPISASFHFFLWTLYINIYINIIYKHI